jgi:RNA polymerase-binding transcription factor DksA
LQSTQEISIGVDMADEFDRASELEETERANALTRVMQNAGPESHPDFNGIHCVDCSDVIPASRLKLGKVRCVYCQQFLEERNAKR